MAITIKTETLALTTEERTWRINIETPKGEMPTITVYRELVRFDADGNVVSKERTTEVTRSAADVAKVSYTAAGATVTGAQLAELIAKVADVERQTDMDVEVARKEEQAAAAATPTKV